MEIFLFNFQQSSNYKMLTIKTKMETPSVSHSILLILKLFAKPAASILKLMKIANLKNNCINK